MFWDRLKSDFTDAIRSLRSHAVATLIALVSLTAAFAAGTYSLAQTNAILWAPLTYPDAERLVFFQSSTDSTRMRGEGYNRWTLPEVVEVLKTQRDILEHVGIARSGISRISGMQLVGGGGYGQTISSNLFSLYGGRPWIGRLFDLDDDRPGSPPVLVLSYTLWKDRFGADTSLIGRQVSVVELSAERAYTVVGVSAPEFSPTPIARMWGNVGALPPDTNKLSTFAVGKLTAGVTLGRLRSQMAILAQAIEEENPQGNGGLAIEVRPLRDHMALEFGGNRLRDLMFTGLAVLGVLLLIATANFGGVLLARSIRRRREYAVRSALGASGGRIAGPIVIETLLISIAGWTGGAVLASWQLSRVAANQASGYQGVDLSLNVLALGVGLLVSVAVGLAFSLAPVRAALAAPLSQTLGRAGFGATRSREERKTGSLLLLLQITAAVAFAVLGGLALDGYMKMRWVGLGFDPAGVAYARISPLPARGMDTPASIPEFRRRLEELLSNSPWTSAFAVTQFDHTRGARMEAGGPTQATGVISGGISLVYGTTDYFQTLGVPLIGGRLFSEAEEDTKSPVALLSETAAQALGGVDAVLGRRMIFGDSVKHEVAVIGVVADVKDRYWGVTVLPTVYLLPDQMGPKISWMEVYARGADGRTAPTAALKTLLQLARAPEMDPPTVNTMEDELARISTFAAFPLRRYGWIVLLALVLAVIGVYGTVAQTVAERVREVGIRRALGATPARIVHAVGGETALTLAAGAAMGSIAALLFRNVLASTFTPYIGVDWRMAFAGAGFFVLAALLGIASPLRRALGVEPMEVLREE